MQAILIPHEGWQLVGETPRHHEGIVANSKGEVFYNTRPDNHTHKIGLDDEHTTFVENNQGGDGQRFGPDGRLYTVATAAEQIIAFDEAGKDTLIADDLRGNDLVCT